MTRAILRSFASLVLLASACIGKPCDKDEQCSDDLVCDFHDGKGTCQEPHGHDSASEATGTTADSDHHHHTSSSTGHDHDHEHTSGATTEAPTTTSG